MKIEEKDINHIEKALGVKLLEHQVDYLLDGGSLDQKGLPKEMETGSGTEKTFAYCIKLLLSEGNVLNLNKPEQFADNWSLQGEERLFYAKKIFRGKFISVWSDLHSYGHYNRYFTLRKIFI